MCIRDRLNNEKMFEGKVKFISSSANPITRTFRVEISVPNPDTEIKDGMTAEVSLKGVEKIAHLVPVSILRLDNTGNLGIRTIDTDGLVAFKEVDIIEDTGEGSLDYWLRNYFNHYHSWSGLCFTR